MGVGKQRTGEKEQRERGRNTRSEWLDRVRAHTCGLLYSSRRNGTSLVYYTSGLCRLRSLASFSFFIVARNADDLFFRLNQLSVSLLRRALYENLSSRARVLNELRRRPTCCAANPCRHTLVHLPFPRQLAHLDSRRNPGHYAAEEGAQILRLHCLWCAGDEPVSSVLGCRYRDPVLLS